MNSTEDTRSAAVVAAGRVARRRAARWWLAPVIAVALVASGCTAHGSSSTAGTANNVESHQVEVIRALPFGDAALAVVAEVLGRSGVGVYDDASPDPATPPVRVTRWQLRNLTAEAANGGGIPGKVLAELAAVPAGAPPLPYLVAAWATSYLTPGARFARALMGEQNWRSADQVLFPSLVLTLFLADATTATNPTTAATPNAVALAAYVADGPCTFAATFIQHAIADVATVLKVNTAGGGFLGFLGTIWNVAVDLAAGAVKGLIDTVTKPVVDLIVDTFGVVAVIAQLSSFLVKWRADLRADPGHTRFGVDAEVVSGQFALTVVQNQLPIPDLVVNCAAAFNVDLRNVGSAAGSKVTWREGRTDLSTRTVVDGALTTDKTARYRYQTRQESSEVAASPQTESPALVVSVSVQRNDIQQVRELFTHLAFDQIPTTIRHAVEKLAQPLIAAADSQLDALTNVTASTRTFITYHLPEPTPTANPATPRPGASVVGRIPSICPSVVDILRAFPRPAVNAGPWMFDGDILPPNTLPTGAKTCGYSASLGAKDPVTGFQQVEQVGLYITPEAETMPAGATPVTVRGADRAWISDILFVVVGDHTLGVQIHIHEGGDLQATAIAVAEVTIGIR